jgi:hypothetical protein
MINYKLISILLILCSFHYNFSQNIWTGEKLTFEKGNFDNPLVETSQDRITDLVWITRANSNVLFNAKTESSAEISGFISPADTEWAEGTTNNLNNLVFTDFKNAAPKSTNGSPKVKLMVGINYVVHLITDDIYIDLKMLSWRSGGNGGGFSYERSTNQNLSIHSNNTSPILITNYVNHHLELENIKNYSRYKIVDISSKTIVSSEFTGSNFIIVNDLNPGLYFLIIDDKKSTKFVKY